MNVTVTSPTYPDAAKVTVNSTVDGNYTVEVNNKTYSVEVVNGTGTVNIDKLSAGKYDVKVTSNVANYENKTKTTKLTVNAKQVDIIELVENYDVIKDYLDPTKYQVHVLLNGKPIGAGKVVTIKTHGVSYKCTTDKNGYAKLIIRLMPKKYSITAEYKCIKVSNKIKVKSVIHVKSVTKKKAKKIKFKATLKYSNGKPIKGKKVIFKLKGKKYTAKTNKKGVAKVTFKKLKVGKYTVKVKYKHDYAKAKLKVKK